MKEFTFFINVHDVVSQIPFGRVTTYGAIAKCLGLSSSSRMVGWALNSVKGTNKIPAHRVVNRLGFLTGKKYFSNPNKMQSLLELEGSIVLNDQIINFNELFWDPSIELSIDLCHI